ncbi:hypothetical protein PILCRDRAFT_97225 [Piloderma croceum F 1598]|uniref:DNA polymerase kappa n=1 Tax=Piloderma croceum (strain F 1598) TaxID=765440 RepID=A0A0C3FVB1_PILCF|nr:hypothetical protein PILCRDRAFT_97225 [Piloderma croceum F 1598]
MDSGTNPPEPSQDTASLVQRLAGPSTGKAGLAKDQTEINRIIAEASKGSKFYENEKKKDKDLTERITRVLKQRDEALQGVDIQMERDLSQYIVHVDMDAFFANVELLYQPDLAGKPFGVGRGVLTTASYEARKYGVRSGMPGFIAEKLCPDLIFVPINWDRYAENSQKVMDVFRRYDPNMNAASIDEAYLNITAYCKDHNIGPEECVREMRAKVQEETNLTASAGIAPNKMLAKICSDKNKPNGQFYLSFDRKTIVTFMHDLPIRKIQGVGRVNERLLEAVGIKTCGDVFTHRAMLSLMDKQFGLDFLLKTYLGIASNVVQPGQREERKSVGSERTFKALSSKEKILQKLEEIALELEGDLNRLGFTGKTVTLKYKLDTYQVFTRARSFDRWISTKKEDLFATGKELLLPELPLTIRLIGLRVTKLKDLRASSPSGGIKRFFEPLNTSAQKRRKLLDDLEQSADLPVMELNQTEPEEAMPGFYEHDEADEELDMVVDNVEGEDHPLQIHATETTVVQTRPRPPVSAPARAFSSRQQNAEASTSSGSRGAVESRTATTSYITRASEAASRSRSAEPSIEAPLDTGATGTLQCPICTKTLETDNQGLNSHIDFCLSRGAIMAAQTKAKSPVKGFKSWGKKNSKSSHGKRKG